MGQVVAETLAKNQVEGAIGHLAVIQHCGARRT